MKISIAKVCNIPAFSMWANISFKIARVSYSKKKL